MRWEAGNREKGRRIRIPPAQEGRGGSGVAVVVGSWEVGSGSIDRSTGEGEEELRRRRRRRRSTDDAGEAEDRRAAAERGEEPEVEGVPARGPRRRPQGHLPHLQGSTGQ
uniref:Uncharacterized protein n=1 Tax=Oryza punctata TaxID=4537 RepID=A0A0E0K284_ORYPU